MFYPIHYFGFDEELIFTYTTGRCWFLVRALQEECGLEPIAFWADGLIHHVGALLPDGTIVDVTGVWDRHTWMRKWANYLEVTAGGEPPQDVLLTAPDDRDWYWYESGELYRNNEMLSEELYLSHTLGSMVQAIIRILTFKNLLPPQ
ncbi:MAG: hypothetical protein H9W81_03365 [Enterococcus sp.]|nr:hypothetical protein [Enterococcus sp.]